MRIGLLGFGVVGRGLYDLSLNCADTQVVKVLCLEDIQLADATVTHDFQDILQDKTIDTVVEVMGGLHPAFDFVKAAIESGKNVVTANKAMVATFYEELLTLTATYGVNLRCTAAVGGGISWLSELERTCRTQSLTQVSGIMNGTCNYILDSMTTLGLGYDEALKQAQALGYAEANPTTDVEGIDTWHKLLLSANIGFNIVLDKASVPVCGISAISAEDVEQFSAHGFVCKLIATGKQQDCKYQAYVQPTLCHKGAPTAAVPKNFNHITFVGSATGIMSLYGQGAGRYPTAHNVLQDCLDISLGKGFYAPLGKKAAASNDEKLRYYVRGTADNWLNEQKTCCWGNAIITAPVTVKEMHQWIKANPGCFVAALPAEE